MCGEPQTECEMMGCKQHWGDLGAHPLPSPGLPSRSALVRLEARLRMYAGESQPLNPQGSPRRERENIPRHRLHWVQGRALRKDKTHNSPIQEWAQAIGYLAKAMAFLCFPSVQINSQAPRPLFSGCIKLGVQPRARRPKTNQTWPHSTCEIWCVLHGPLSASDL